MRANRSR